MSKTNTDPTLKYAVAFFLVAFAISSAQAEVKEGQPPSSGEAPELTTMQEGIKSDTQKIKELKKARHEKKKQLKKAKKEKRKADKLKRKKASKGTGAGTGTGFIDPAQSPISEPEAPGTVH